MVTMTPDAPTLPGSPSSSTPTPASRLPGPLAGLSPDTIRMLSLVAAGAAVGFIVGMRIARHLAEAAAAIPLPAAPVAEAEPCHDCGQAATIDINAVARAAAEAERPRRRAAPAEPAPVPGTEVFPDPSPQGAPEPGAAVFSALVTGE
jgi:hypothetical protein